MTVSHRSKKILVVDDDKLLNDSLRRKFQHLGFETEGCYNGKQGLDLMSREQFDGIVLDLLMPVTDGFTVLATKAATANADTPAFVLTSLDNDKCDRARELGAKTIFDKLEMSPADVASEVQRELVAA